MKIKRIDSRPCFPAEIGDDLDADYLEIYNTLKDLSPEERKEKVDEITV
jgi:hypothetical protein